MPRLPIRRFVRGALAALLMTFVLPTAPVEAQCLVGRLLTSDATVQAKVGTSVAIDGDVMVVGASSDSTLGGEAGAAYVFRYNGGAWVEEQKLLPSDGVANDLFGHTVAVDGDVIVVGGYAGLQIGIINGAAYIYRFDGATWNEEAILSTSTPILADFFGYSVAVSGDRVAVGDPGNSIFSSPPGYVTIFDYNGTSWLESAIVTSSTPALDDFFGWSVALEGDRLAVGAPGQEVGGVDRGRAYAFDFDGTSWVESELVPVISNDYDQLGTMVALDGSRIVATTIEVEPGVGATGPGSALVFDEVGGVWSESARLSSVEVDPTDDFGVAIALAGDVIIAGVPGAGAGGMTVRFDYDGLSWVEGDPLVAVPNGFSDQYGFAVAISGDRAAATAPRHDQPEVNAGAIYTFDLETSPTPFQRGDANGDTLVDLGDAIWLLVFIFQEGAPPPCRKAADTNGDGTLDLGDAIYLINYAFLDGNPPPAPFLACGVESTSSGLCCLQSACP